MAVTHVKAGAGAPINAGSTVTFTYTPAGTGNGVLFYVSLSPSGTSPTSATAAATGWTITPIGGIINGGSSAGTAQMFWAYAPNTSAATITVTFNQPGSGFSNWLIDEWSGMDTTNFVDNSNSATGSGTPTVSITPVNDNCGIWVASDDSITAVGTIGGTAATKGGDDGSQDWSEWLVLTGGTGSAKSCTFTGSGAYTIGVVSIKPLGVGPTIGSVPSGTALTTPAFTAKFLFFDTGDYGIGI